MTNPKQHEELVRGPALNYTPGGNLIMEYVNLPIVDTNKRFLYRFTSPIEMVWVEGNISIAEFFNCAVNQSPLEAFASREWVKIFNENHIPGINPEVDKAVKELSEIKNIEVYQCEIKRK